jgi:hypothetical protein
VKRPPEPPHVREFKAPMPRRCNLLVRIPPCVTAAQRAVPQKRAGRQTFGFGGEEETVESSYGQMAGKRDVSRLTVQVGRFAVHDVFDTNAYATDSRADFMNWSIWAAGAFDYPADKIGLTYGAVAELNQKQWALRAGYFLAGNEPNSNQFDMRAPRTMVDFDA